MKLSLYSGNLSIYILQKYYFGGGQKSMHVPMNGLYDIAFMDLGSKYPFALELLGFNCLETHFNFETRE
jgi:hypothetical protein